MLNIFAWARACRIHGPAGLNENQRRTPHSGPRCTMLAQSGNVSRPSQMPTTENEPAAPRRRAWTKLVTLAMIGSVLGVLLLRLHVQSAKFQASANNLRELRAAALLKCKSRCSGLGMCKGFSFYYSSAIHGYACSPKSSVCADKPLTCDDLLGFCFYVRKPQQYLQVCNCKKEKTNLYIYPPVISIQC